MAKNYYISGNSKNGYRGLAQGASRAGFTGNTQGSVIKQVRQSMKVNGGGELRIQSVNGKFRAADTISPKIDKFPPRG